MTMSYASLEYLELLCQTMILNFVQGSQTSVIALISSTGSPRQLTHRETDRLRLPINWCNSIEEKLREGKSNRWVEELPTTIWTVRISVRGSTGETPYVLVYGS